MKIIYFVLLLAFVSMAGPAGESIAGNSYHGYGMQMNEMSVMDSNGDGTITFDEFSAPTVDRLKSGFDMLDTDNSGKIDQKEWDEYLKVHGFDVGSDS
jgi:hypothetical protein